MGAPFDPASNVRPWFQIVSSLVRHHHCVTFCNDAVAKSDAAATPVGVQHVEPDISCRAAALLARLSQDLTACAQLRAVS
jgi:hypothetical protein